MPVKVSIIYPPISREERFGTSLGHSGGRQIPLGIFYLAAYVRKHGHTVQVIDAEAENLTTDGCVKKITSFAPDVLGISSTTVAFHRAIELAKAYRAAHPDVFTVIGGPHPSSNIELTLRYDCFSCAVFGEGEETLGELLRCLAEGEEWRSLDGIAYRGNEGKVTINNRRKAIECLDSIPFPAYDLIPDITVYSPQPSKYRRFPVANIITSRGCPNQCSFCDQSVFGRTLRQRSPENIASEMQLLRNAYGIQEINFVDDTFTIGFQRIPKIFAILKDADIDFSWMCNSRINTLTREGVRQLREYGCWQVAFGLESGDAEILKKIKKNINLDQVREVLQWCRDEGIETSGFFMIGHPGETLESIERTMAFALSLPLSGLVASINTPIPGSPQYAEIKEYGSLDETDWTRFNLVRPVFIPKGLDEKMLLQKHRELYRRFYFRPHIIFSFLRSFFEKSNGGGCADLFLLSGLCPI